jgi:hypothetical protein
MFMAKEPAVAAFFNPQVRPAPNVLNPDQIFFNLLVSIFQSGQPPHQ